MWTFFADTGRDLLSFVMWCMGISFSLQVAFGVLAVACALIGMLSAGKPPEPEPPASPARIALDLLSTWLRRRGS